LNSRKWLYIKWNGTSYFESTWEIAADCQDDKAFENYCKSNYLGPDGLRLAPRPNPPNPKRRDQLMKEFKQYTESPKFPNGGSLRHYQVDSLNWLSFNWMQGRNSMLADEMGLGKTLQTASFTRHLYSFGKMAGPTLVVAPLSTLQHWRREFHNWTGLNSIIYHGNKESRQVIQETEFFHARDMFAPKGVDHWKGLVGDVEKKISHEKLVGKKIRKHFPGLGCFTGVVTRVMPGTAKDGPLLEVTYEADNSSEDLTKAEVLRTLIVEAGSSDFKQLLVSGPYKFDVLVTSYETLTSTGGRELQKIPWALMVVDEAHRLKNHKSKLYTTLMEDVSYTNSLLLTGTPVQNEMEEMFTLLHFLDQDKFADKEDFMGKFGDLKSSAQVRETSEKFRKAARLCWILLCSGGAHDDKMQCFIRYVWKHPLKTIEFY
jgi:SNF2 family DNA or RNA helicase